MQSWKHCAPWLSLQWFCENSCTWAHDVWLLIAGTNEPKSVQQANQGSYTKTSDKYHYLSCVSTQVLLSNVI